MNMSESHSPQRLNTPGATACLGLCYCNSLSPPTAGDIHSIAITPDGSTIAVGDSERRIHLVDGATLALTSKGAWTHNGRVTALAFNPSGKVRPFVAVKRDAALLT